jgi:RES domain-containing protein
MIVYRVSRDIYSSDLSGTGAEIHGGRWNSPGRKLLYTAINASLALLEALAWTPMSTLLSGGFVLIRIESPDGSLIEIPNSTLSAGWQNLIGYQETQGIGDHWIDSVESLSYKVPSALLPIESNVLINPAHHMMSQVRISEVFDLVFDPRLLDR